jgi:23S rRNA C2498 (ribose-2'-O)-methylase RlmM
MLAATRPQILLPEEEENQWLHKALQRQFQHVEQYCNAQTRLHNALLEEDRAFQSTSLQTYIIELEECLRKVQKDLGSLQAKELRNQRRMEVLLSHVERSKRVLLTVYENGAMLHPNGIPATKDNVAIKTVALSTLRASMVQLERKFGI